MGRSSTYSSPIAGISPRPDGSPRQPWPRIALAEVITDREPARANVIEGLIQAAFHNTGQYETNRCEARLGPMRGLKADRTPSVVIRGSAFVQNLRRGRYELGVEVAPVFRLATAFDELQLAI
jgi:hypothetical protein